MATGFEFVEQGPIKTTAAEALDDATHVLETVNPEHPDGLSVDAFFYGLQGRGVTPEAAQDVLTFLHGVGRISLADPSGRIQYPPRS